jgi:hypothetical protein
MARPLSPERYACRDRFRSHSGRPETNRDLRLWIVTCLSTQPNPLTGNSVMRKYLYDGLELSDRL